MAKIQLLDNNTIDKIAAGEVVERPMSVVKELVENSIDAGSSIITVEIQGGGIKTIRVTDNGCGIESDQIRNAFLSHATSKIHDANDLNALFTLGFRGEALASVAAVSRVEITSRTKDALTGIHYVIEGGKEIKCEEVGAPAGTTIIIRDIFYNTLPRLKFLKSEATEGTYISDMMEHMALSMPHISFRYISNGKTKFTTSGRDDLREVIFRLYGREISDNLRSIEVYNEELSLSVSGFLGLPRINRSNRALEIFFINHRYIKSPLLSKAVEEGYVEYLMQHKFPFCILNLNFNPEKVDVNVHPTKQEVRLSDEKKVYDAIVGMIHDRLAEREMIDAIKLNVSEKEKTKPVIIPEQFEQSRIIKESKIENATVKPAFEPTKIEKITVIDNSQADDISKAVQVSQADTLKDDDFFVDETIEKEVSETKNESNIVIPEDASDVLSKKYKDFEQIDFLENDKLLSVEARRQYRIIGQAFKTYWLIEYKDSLMLMDQHAAHEKVRFERLMSFIREKKEVPSQNIIPPVVMSLSNREKQILLDNIERFEEIGFIIEDFGEHDIVIRSIPLDLYGSKPEDLVFEIINDLVSLHKSQTPDAIRSRIASMACKGAVKGNNSMSVEEVEALLDEMLTLDNPYNCPHGRPTIVSFTKSEMEKMFHRIV